MPDKKKHRRRHQRRAGANNNELKSRNLSKQANQKSKEPPLSDKQDIQSSPPRPRSSQTQLGTEKRSWLRWITGWRLFVELVTVAAFVISAYVARPVLSVTSYGISDRFGADGLKVVVTNSGLKIREVSVQCVTNKAVFDDKYTIEFARFFAMNEYSVPDVGTGESFTADCDFIWSLFMRSDSGVFVAGGGASHDANHLGIPFLIKDGKAFMDPNTPAPAMFRTLNPDASKKNLSALDVSFIISYKWPRPMLPLKQERTIHAIAQRTLIGGRAWRIAPESEPVIPDGNLPGFKITGGSGRGKKWMFELGHDPPQTDNCGTRHLRPVTIS